MTTERFVEELISQGLLDGSQRSLYLDVIEVDEIESDIPMGLYWVKARNELLQLVAHKMEVNFYDLTEYRPSQQMLATLTSDMAKKFKAIPIQVSEGGLEMALINPFDFENLKAVEAAISQTVIPAIAPIEQIQELIERYDSF